MKIDYVSLGISKEEFYGDIVPLLEKVFTVGDFVGGKAVEEFEHSFAELCGTKHAVALASGTDSLYLTMRAFGIGEGDEVITVGNSFIATTNAIMNAGAVPVICDIADDLLIDTAKIEPLINEKTKAILPVHLTGLVCDMDSINALASEYGLKVIEDAAQSAGAEYKGKMSGSLGDAGCFSLHPLKNLAGIGDGGIVTTDDAELAGKLVMLRNHGMIDRDHQMFSGYVSRLDTINAAVLNHRIEQLGEIITSRRHKASVYNRELAGINGVHTPKEPDGRLHTFHVYIIQAENREKLAEFLDANGIETKIHYPVLPHKQPCFKGRAEKLQKTEQISKKILTLPLAKVTDEEIVYIAEKIREFYAS